MLISMIGFKLLLTLPGLAAHHEHLEYARVFVISNGIWYSIDCIIYGIVHFMLHLLTQKALQTQEIWQKVVKSFTEPNVFDSSPLLQLNFFKLICSESTILKMFKKIPENWKTTMRTKSIQHRQKFIDSLPKTLSVPSEGFILRLVCNAYFLRPFHF